MDAPHGSSQQRIGIGALLRELEPDFPGITASKIRFLEDQGLVHPRRTASGYRKYAPQDRERLRAVLRLQREQYMPLRVIRDLADSGRLGEAVESAAPEEARRTAPDAEAPATGPALRPSLDDDGPLSLRELCRRSGAGIPLVRELLSFGLLCEGPGHFDAHDVEVAAAARELQAYGVEPRHLKTLRQAAEREFALVGQAVGSEAMWRTPQARRRAAERAEEITRLCLGVHAALVSARLRDLQRAADTDDEV